MRLAETTPGFSRDAQYAARRRRLARDAPLGVGLLLLFAGSGWAFLSQVEGWLGVALWMIVSVPLCLLVEFVLRPRATIRRSAKSLPRMQVRAPMRGELDRSPGSTRSQNNEFSWHRGDDAPAPRKRRRSFAGR
ncbi:MAG: hypothetical protein P8R42_26970 [Candidatus Binatia bacterium]|nr:hypothetical protein [Candidatus Binatia bacterium]